MQKNVTNDIREKRRKQKKEYRMCRDAEHKYIVQVFGLIVGPDSELGIVMELMGKDLSKVLNPEGHICPEKALKTLWLQQIAEAVKYVDLQSFIFS